MKKASSGALLAVALTGALILPAACAEPESTASAPPTTSAVQSNPWLDLLRVIPATGNTTSAYVQNYALLAARQKQYPAVAEVPEGMMLMQNNRFWDVLRTNPDEWQRNMGFVMADMDQEAFASRIPPVDQYQFLVGRFDRAKIEAALKSDPINDDLQIVTYSGVPYFSAAEDGMTLGKRSNLRPLGQGLRLALLDNQMFYTNFTRTMQEMIDAHQDKIQSLADLESYQQLATGLAELVTFTAFFSSESQAQSHVREVYRSMISEPNNEYQRSFAKQVDRGVTLEPYLAFATGAGLDDKGYYMAIVILNADQETAKANSLALVDQIKNSSLATPEGGKPWQDLIESLDVRSEGRLTLAKMYGRVSTSWRNFDMPTGMYQPLLMHKG
jgi:hypothetical protein